MDNFFLPGSGRCRSKDTKKSGSEPLIRSMDHKSQTRYAARVFSQLLGSHNGKGFNILSLYIYYETFRLNYAKRGRKIPTPARRQNNCFAYF
jgi:hypothetical protein